MENMDIQTFVQMGSNGLITANFTQVREALIERYKSIYGSDIDLSTGSADGIFVNDLALIINNILQTMSELYNNLDVDRASGIYLDNLCKLSNVYRNPGSYSWAWVSVTNNGTEPLEDVTNLVFVDKGGNEWVCPDTHTIAVGATVAMKAICQIEGPVEAPVGWIDRTLELLPVTVEQSANAKLGTYNESDASLRFRRSRSSGINATTVESGLFNALLQIPGIEDVKIYNNNTENNMPADDTTTIAPHSVYIVLRTDDTHTITDLTVGSMIHNKLTPGIRTCESAERQGQTVGGTQHSYEYEDYVYGIKIDENTQMVYWKVAAEESPDLTITIYPNPNFLGYEEVRTVANYLMTTLNEMPIGTTLTLLDITYAMLNADPRYSGRATYNQIDASNPDGTWPIQFEDTYMDYNDFVCGNNGVWDATSGTGYKVADNQWIFKLVHND